MMIHIIIDEPDYLPKAMVLFDTNYVPGTRCSQTTFQFEGREVNFSILTEQLNLFHREFYEPKLPAGWTRKVNPADPRPCHRRTRPAAPSLRTVPLPRGVDRFRRTRCKHGWLVSVRRWLAIPCSSMSRLPAVSGPMPVPTLRVSAASGGLSRS